MKKFKTTLLLLLFTTLFFGQDTATQKAITNHPGNFYTTTKNYTNSTIDGYNLYVPKSCTSKSKPFPVIVFLQGGLGVGGDVDVIYNWALPKRLKDTRKLSSEYNTLLANTFVVIMPHINSGQFYTNENAMRAILKEVAANYNINTKRIYLTGLSRGGHGTWGLASRMADVFAAAAPICGSPSGVEDYKALSKIPIWASHNTGDGVVNYNNTLRTVERIESVSDRKFLRTSTISGTDYRKGDYIFTSGKSDSHDAWTEMYGDPKVFKWFLKYQLK